MARNLRQTGAMAFQLPATQQAVVEDANGKAKFVDSTPLPPLLPGTLVVKTEAVALNPMDNKMGEAFPTPGAVIGCDFAGIVIAVHQGTKTNINIGDRVCGMIHGSNTGEPTNGAFAEYVRARPELLIRVPKQCLLKRPLH